jgi:hypothetical protein
VSSVGESALEGATYRLTPESADSSKERWMESSGESSDEIYGAGLNCWNIDPVEVVVEVSEAVVSEESDLSSHNSCEAAG